MAAALLFESAVTAPVHLVSKGNGQLVNIPKHFSDTGHRYVPLEKTKAKQNGFMSVGKNGTLS